MVPLDWVFFSATALAALFAAQPFLQLLQAESYQLPRYFLRIKEDPGLARWLRRMWCAGLLSQIVVFVLKAAEQTVRFFLYRPQGTALSIASTYVAANLNFFGCALPAAFLAIVLIRFALWFRQPSRPVLLFSARMIRLQACLAVLLLGLQVGVYQLVYKLCIFAYRLIPNSNLMLKVMVFYTVLIAAFALVKLLLEVFAVRLVPRAVALASIVMQPLEKMITRENRIKV